MSVNGVAEMCSRLIDVQRQVALSRIRTALLEDCAWGADSEVELDVRRREVLIQRQVGDDEVECLCSSCKSCGREGGTMHFGCC